MMIADPVQTKFLIKLMLHLRVGTISFDLLTELHSQRLLRDNLNAERKLRIVSGTVLNTKTILTRVKFIEPNTWPHTC